LKRQVWDCLCREFERKEGMFKVYFNLQIQCEGQVDAKVGFKSERLMKKKRQEIPYNVHFPETRKMRIREGQRKEKSTCEDEDL
jgi:hypothetical protein